MVEIPGHLGAGSGLDLIERRVGHEHASRPRDLVAHGVVAGAAAPHGGDRMRVRWVFVGEDADVGLERHVPVRLVGPPHEWRSG